MVKRMVVSFTRGVGGDCDWKSIEGDFQVLKNVLFLDLNAGYTGVCSLCRSS